MDSAFRLAKMMAPRKQRGETVVFCTVATVSPLTVVVDGDTDAVPAVAGCPGITTGARVVVLRAGRQVVVVAVVGGCPYDVGDLYVTTSSTAPGDRWPNTTWEVYGAGRMLVSRNASDADFDTVGETGGSKDAVVVTHSHKWESSVYSSVIFRNRGATQGGITWNSGGTYHYDFGNTRDTATTGESGTGKNLPPYVVVNVWRRTA